MGYDRFFVGRFFHDATSPGGDIDYGYVMFQYDIFEEKMKKPAK